MIATCNRIASRLEKAATGASSGSLSKNKAGGGSLTKKLARTTAIEHRMTQCPYCVLPRRYGRGGS